MGVGLFQFAEFFLICGAGGRVPYTYVGGGIGGGNILHPQS